MGKRPKSILFEPPKWLFCVNFVTYPMRLNARDFLSHIWSIEIFVLWKGGPEKSLKMGILDHFHPPKWLILTKLAPLMTLLTKFMPINLTEIIFNNFYRKKCLTTFPKFWPVASLWTPKMTQFLPKNDISTKLPQLMTFLTKFMPINLTEIIFINI